VLTFWPHGQTHYRKQILSGSKVTLVLILPTKRNATSMWAKIMLFQDKQPTVIQ